MARTRVAFLDRDGTLSHEVGYVNHPSRYRLYPWSVDAVRAINRAGWLAVLIPDMRRAAEEPCALGAGPLRIHSGQAGDPAYTPAPATGFENLPEGADLILATGFDAVDVLLDHAAVAQPGGDVRGHGRHHEGQHDGGHQPVRSRAHDDGIHLGKSHGYPLFTFAWSDTGTRGSCNRPRTGTGGTPSIRQLTC